MAVVVIGYLGWVLVTLITLDSAEIPSRSRTVRVRTGRVLFMWDKFGDQSHVDGGHV